MKTGLFNKSFLFLEAWFFLTLAKLFILFFPFKKIASWIGDTQSESSKENEFKELVFQVEYAVRRAGDFVLFKSKCYDQALATTLMLKRRAIPSTIYFGLYKSESDLKAHAWVRYGDFIVAGKHGHERFTPVAWFATQSKI